MVGNGHLYLNGADFADVVPLRGVILGGGMMQRMDVSVSVIPQG